MILCTLSNYALSHPEDKCVQMDAFKEQEVHQRRL